MGDLGTMEPEEILQLLTGSVACAFVIVLFIVAYVVIARRGKGTGKRRGPGLGSYSPGTLSMQPRAPTSLALKDSVGVTPSDTLAVGTLGDTQALSIDVSARLLGTGREAWLEEESAHAVDSSEADEHASDHGHEVLRLLRDPQTGQLWVQVAGVRYRSLTDIRDRTVGERVLAAITHLLRFSNGLVATDQGVRTLELPACNAVKVPAAFGVLSEGFGPGEVIRLMSKPKLDRFCVHVAGQCYRWLVDVSERETGQYVLEAITRMLQFSNGLLATDDGVGVIPVPPLRADAQSPPPIVATQDPQVSDLAYASAASMPGRDSQAAQPVDMARAGSASQISEQDLYLQQIMSQTVSSQSQAPVERPSLVSSIRRMRKEASTEPLPSLNLAEEIDRIFQRNLMTSGLSTANASVETNSEGGVRIRVGTVHYESPDQVPDPRLRELLKLSIAEWERS